MYRMCLMLLVALLVVLPVSAQDVVPAVSVSDQLSLDGTVVIDSATSDGPGFVVIHIDNGEGGPGPVIGNAPLNPGDNFNIPVAIDTTQATPLLFAMLHTDTGEVGAYEFGTVEGADGPVRDAAGNVITPSFNVNVVNMSDQRVTALGTVVAASVTAAVDGFLVIHTEADGGPGPVAGVEAVRAGTTNNILIQLDMNEPTPVLWPMLHVDTGEAGVYEFGTVQGADGPVVVDGTVATFPIWTVPYMRVADQIVLRSDSQLPNARPSVVAASVLADQHGFLVIHTEADGGPGPVAGFAEVRAGTNLNVEVSLDPSVLTPRLWPMLHVDTGEAGVYEFGTVQGADGPVRDADGNVITFGINAAPSITFSGELGADSLTIAQAMIDQPGWLAIHSDNGGSPGPVIGNAPLRPGVNENVVVALDPAAAGGQVFPMLHYDTNDNGIYEFGAVEGADGPVFVAGAVVVGPLELGAPVDAGSGAGDSESMAGCTVTRTGSNANLRQGPGTEYPVPAVLAGGESAAAVGQAQGADGFVWWNLDSGFWVRADVVSEDGDCEGLPTVDAPAPPASSGGVPAGGDVPAPAATEEASA